MKIEKEELILALKALADTRRLKIIELLSKGSMCACEVLDHFDVTQPTLSHHMKILEKANLIVVEKKGQWHHYTIREETVTHLFSNMEDIFNNSKK